MVVKVAQFDTGLPSELGVQTKYLDRKRNFVDHALAGRLHLAPQFKVARRVVQAITVFVVDVFTFSQRATKNLGHYDSVLKGLAASTQVQTPVSGRVDMPRRINWTPSAAFVTALFRAKTLAFVIAGVFAVLGSAKSTLLSFAAELTLESRRWLLVHEHWLARVLPLVKTEEKFLCPSQA